MWHIKTKQNLLIGVKIDFQIFLGIYIFTSIEVAQCPIQSRHSLNLFLSEWIVQIFLKNLWGRFIFPKAVETGRIVWSYKEIDLDLNCSQLPKDGLARTGEWVPRHWGYSSWTIRILSEVSRNWKSGWDTPPPKYFDSDYKGNYNCL